MLDVNDRFVEMYGFSRDEAIGRTPLDLGLWAHPEKREEMIAELRAKGEVRNWPVLARRKDGAVFPALYSLSHLDGTHPPLILGVVRDVTEQRRAEEDLRASQGRFKTLVDKAPIAVGISRNGRTIYVNQKYLVMFGYQTVEELEGQPIREQWSDQDADTIEERARRRANTSASASRTRAAASPRTCCRASSSPSSRRRNPARAPASAWPRSSAS